MLPLCGVQRVVLPVLKASVFKYVEIAINPTRTTAPDARNHHFFAEILMFAK
jgi:hypothetical protein